MQTDDHATSKPYFVRSKQKKSDMLLLRWCRSHREVVSIKWKKMEPKTGICGHKQTTVHPGDPPRLQVGCKPLHSTHRSRQTPALHRKEPHGGGQGWLKYADTRRGVRQGSRQQPGGYCHNLRARSSNLFWIQGVR